MEAFWNPPSETGGEITSYLTRIRYTRSDGRHTTKYKCIRDPTVHQWKPDPFPSERPVYFQVERVYHEVDHCKVVLVTLIGDLLPHHAHTINLSLTMIHHIILVRHDFKTDHKSCIMLLKLYVFL